MEYSSNVLLVRHLPAELTDVDKKELLLHFGAKSVKSMGTSGPMKHTAFAKFDSTEAAGKCLQRLHQLDVLGHKLVVEFAKSTEEKDFPQVEETHKNVSKDSLKDEKKEKLETPKLDITGDASFQKYGIQYQKKPTLYYLYPPPTVSTLTNIANALASYPKFYTQVLHLMNKMNLPCPFGAVTASPPLAMENTSKTRSTNMGNSEITANEIDEIEMEQESTEESEIESEGESGEKNIQLKEGEKLVVQKSVKRPRKKMRLIQPDMSVIIKPTIIATPKDVFENADDRKPKQITLNIPSTTSLGPKTQDTFLQDYRSTGADENVGKNMESGVPQVEKLTVVEAGFGKVEPQVRPQHLEEVQKPDANYSIDPEQFFAKDNVASGRLKKSQFKDFSVFKNYSPGECTSRLYIKNLTKHTTEQELVNLFGPYINWSASLAYEAFDIRLMKEGRMKGQAFVTLPDEESAQAIVTECNGYILNNKPMVIQFARSAKAREVDKLVAE